VKSTFLFRLGVVLAASLSVASCGGDGGASPSNVVGTPSPTPIPTPRADGRTAIGFNGHYDHATVRYTFDSGTFTMPKSGALDVTAQISEPSGKYQFALLRSESPGECSGVVVATAYAPGDAQTAHWDSIPAGTYCMNVGRDPRDRSYSWSGSVVVP
jgi:hypothetical protein